MPARDLPPWERARAQLLVVVSTEAHQRCKTAAARAGVPMWYVVDTLILTFAEAELVDLVRRAQEADGAARAAWARSGRLPP